MLEGNRLACHQIYFEYHLVSYRINVAWIQVHLSSQESLREWLGLLDEGVLIAF